MDSRFDFGIVHDVWTALRGCKVLRELSVVDAGDQEIEGDENIMVYASYHSDDPHYLSRCSTRFRDIQESQVCHHARPLGLMILLCVPDFHII